ncbi:MAG: hypothetical protein IPO32_00885 [Crocinitomicaceae bacterium]|nr:hypothetical protein [Crocinitomicaceae bacterium]
MKQLVLLITFFGFGFLINAQSSLPKNVADSLWNVWSDDDQPDTIRMTTMYELIWEGYLYTRPDSANFYAQTLLSFCQEKSKSQTYSS